jgi:VanZ family protein
LALAYSLLAFVLGSLPGNGGLPTHNDKLLHGLAFGVQVWFAFPLMRKLYPQTPEHSVGRAVLYASVVGGLLELWQMLMPTRQAEWLDWVADSVGAALFGLALFGVLKLVVATRAKSKLA